MADGAKGVLEGTKRINECELLSAKTTAFFPQPYNRPSLWDVTLLAKLGNLKLNKSVPYSLCSSHRSRRNGVEGVAA